MVAVSVIAHPHPLYGGSMHNNVVEAFWRHLPDLGILSLRFNFRGVGASEGYFEEGVGERQDLNGALQFLRDLGYAHLPHFFIGYSFGAYVIHLSEPLPEATAGVVMISPPISMVEFDPARFKGPYPYLILSGNRDPYCQYEVLEDWDLPGKNVTLKVMNGIDHFWIGKERSLLEAFRSWSAPLLSGAPI